MKNILHRLVGLVVRLWFFGSLIASCGFVGPNKGAPDYLVFICISPFIVLTGIYIILGKESVSRFVNWLTAE